MLFAGFKPSEKSQNTWKVKAFRVKGFTTKKERNN
jgi:hypothetical protein